MTNYTCNYGPDEEDKDEKDDYDENAWMDACDPDELSCEDGDDDHWNGDLG